MHIRPSVSAMVFLIAVPLLAQRTAGNPVPGAEANAAPCTLTGVWHGGSNPLWPYTFTVTPTTANHYTTVGELGAEPGMFGYTWMTAWAGEVTKVEQDVYEWWAIQYLFWDPEQAKKAGVDGSLPELDIVHSRMVLLDCNTMQSTIDVYGAYFAYTSARTPFTDPTDLDWLNGTPIVETYHRLPTPKSIAPSLRQATRESDFRRH